jgi:hypothetical protein
VIVDEHLRLLVNFDLLPCEAVVTKCFQQRLFVFKLGCLGLVG